MPKMKAPKHPKHRNVGPKKTATHAKRSAPGATAGKARKGKVGGAMSLKKNYGAHVETTGGWGRKKSGGKRKKRTSGDVAKALHGIR